MNIEYIIITIPYTVTVMRTDMCMGMGMDIDGDIGLNRKLKWLMRRL
jgi:hypothetical protein